MPWLLHDGTDNQNPLCNFLPEVIGVLHIHTDTESEPVLHVNLRLAFWNEIYSDVFTEPLADIGNISWMHKDRRCRFHPEASPNKVNRYLLDVVRNSLPEKFTRLYRVSSLGVHIVEEEVTFCTGGGLIRPSTGQDDRPDIQPDSIPHNLDIDPNLTEDNAIAGMLELVSLCPNPGRLIFAHSALYLMRALYEAAWKSPRTCIFLYGLTGTKKTTFASFLTQIYNRSKGIVSPTRLNASIAAAVAILYEKRDCAMVLDDLFPSIDSSVRRQQEETLIEITRIVADGIEPARMRGYKVAKAPPTCGVVFTGEYLIGTGSDAARLLPVEMTQIDGNELKHFQDNPLIVSTFYHGFIRWFIENYSCILELLKEWRKVYQSVDIGVHARLQETHFFLNTAYSLLLQYCHERCLLSEQDTENLHQSFLRLLMDLVQAQDKRVNQGKIAGHTESTYLARICDAYLGNAFDLADSPKKFLDLIHDGLIHNGCLCLRGDKIRKLFPDVPLEDVISGLEAQGAIKRGVNDRAIQIYGTGGKRFYAIPLAKLG